MKYEQISEGLTHGDLKGLVMPGLSVAEFEPKTGNEEDVIVVGFYVKDDRPAQDLATFIEKGSVDILDTEVSPNPDEDGNYMVFIELKNEDIMNTVMKLLEDVNRIVNLDDYALNFFQGKSIKVTKEQIESYLKK